MSYIEIFVIGLGLAMDAFTMAVCKGMVIKKIDNKDIFKVGSYFGLFQALMPIIGFFLAYGFKNYVMVIDHWIAFCLLVIIGVNMLYDVYCGKECEVDSYVNFSSMIMPALATSIDALAVGITFAFFEINIFLAGLIIGVITFVLTSIGVLIGNKLGDKGNNKIKIIGGIILILMGVKILLEHL